MSSIKDSQESEVFNSFECTKLATIFFPLSVVQVLEFLLVSPVDVIGPGFTTSPVADKVFVTTVDQNFVFVVDKIADILGKIQLPIIQQSQMDISITLAPGVSLNTQSVDDLFLGKIIIQQSKVVAKGRNFTFFSDIIRIESGLKGITQNDFHDNVTFFKIKNIRNMISNHGITDSKSSLETFIFELSNKLILIGKFSVLRVLADGVNPTITNSGTLEIDFGVLLAGNV
mmetsp:Transcript_36822/g.33041  ORF Transcript_36822/g.33041 Transcript_36822/m.33041 type:complete len:229 (-) Transcript_36822:545-1231(-)